MVVLSEGGHNSKVKIKILTEELGYNDVSLNVIFVLYKIIFTYSVYIFGLVLRTRSSSPHIDDPSVSMVTSLCTIM